MYGWLDVSMDGCMYVCMYVSMFIHVYTTNMINRINSLVIKEKNHYRHASIQTQMHIKTIHIHIQKHKQAQTSTQRKHTYPQY